MSWWNKEMSEIAEFKVYWCPMCDKLHRKSSKLGKAHHEEAKRIRQADAEARRKEFSFNQREKEEKK